MSTQTPEELASGTFAPHQPTEADYALYRTYSTTRLRLLAWFGSPEARKVLTERGK